MTLIFLSLCMCVCVWCRLLPLYQPGKFPYDINGRNSYGWTLLHTVAANATLPLVVELLRHPDIDVNARDPDGRTSLQRSCRENSVKVARILLSDPRIDVNLPTNLGYSPVWMCANRRNTEIAKMLIISDRTLKLDQEAPDEMGVSLTAIQLEERCRATKLTLLYFGTHSSLVSQSNRPHIWDKIFKRFSADPVGVRQEVLRDMKKEHAPAVEGFLGLSRFFIDAVKLAEDHATPPGPGDITELDISSVAHFVPQRFGGLNNLKKLNISGSSIPEGLVEEGSQISLATLCLVACGISQPLPFFSRLAVNLTSLVIRECGLRHFPEALSKPPTSFQPTPANS